MELLFVVLLPPSWSRRGWDKLRAGATGDAGPAFLVFITCSLGNAGFWIVPPNQPAVEKVIIIIGSNNAFTEFWFIF